jgi:fatty acid desaturase
MSAATPIQAQELDTAPSASPSPESSGWDWRDSMSRDELQELLAIDDRRAWLTLATNWGLIFASFALVAWAPNPFTILLALFVIGARQLGFAVVMHEAAHRTFFSNRALNDWAGNWLAAYPVWTDLVPYRHYHLKHHAKTGTAEDPDLGLVLPFPITPASMRRKIWRDLSGQTGWKQATAVAKRDLGLGDKASMRNQAPFNPASDQPRTGWRVIAPVVITNGILLGILALFGAPELYLLWVVAWFTTNRLVTRLRSIAEHAMCDDMSDPLRNTRTTIASWWERFLLAPNRVNYHLEHHLLMTVPHHNLPRLHTMLRDRGALAHANVAHGYWGVFRNAASKPAS